MMAGPAAPRAPAGVLFGLLAVVGFACSSSSSGGKPDGGGPPAGHTNPLPQAQIDAFVAAHNQARSGPLTPPPSPPLPPVSWDAALADVAFNYLGKCQGTQQLVSHNANRTTDYAALGGTDYVGENIYATTGTATPADAVAAWVAEAPSFDYASGDFGSAGHYTQVVWRASVRIGCAIVDCPSVQFNDTVLCDYAPGGNIIGEKPY